MKKENNEELLNDNEEQGTEINYIPNQWLLRNDRSQNVISTAFDSIFIPSKRLPKSLLDTIATDSETLQKHLLAELPLTEHEVKKPYWSKGANSKIYDTMKIEIYGSICLADDRHCLDCIIATGGLLDMHSEYTLRTAAEQCGLEVVWDYYSDQSQIDELLPNEGVCFHTTFSALTKAMGIDNTKANRKSILQRLLRLSLMMLYVRFYKDGKELSQNDKMRLVHSKFYPVCSTTNVRNKKIINEETLTDIFIIVDKKYVASLTTDGRIGRDYFIKDFTAFNGKNSIVDFFKYLESHEKSWLHKKSLTELVSVYYSEKMDLYGMNKHHKASTTINLVAEKKDEILETYGIELKKIETKLGKTDYLLLHIPTMEKNSGIV